MLDLQADTREVEAQIGGLATAVQDWKRPLRAFRAYMASQVSKQVRTAGKYASGGSARGVAWARAKPRYVRKTDGQVVPIWGGVAKIGGKSWIAQRARANARSRGEKPKSQGGKVKGRLNSRKQKRVTPGSRIFQGWSAKRLRVLMKKQSEDAFSITMGPPKPFSHLTGLRPWAHFTNDDVERLERFVGMYFRIRERG